MSKSKKNDALNAKKDKIKESVMKKLNIQPDHLSEDDYDESYDLMESSLPFEGLAEKTKGMQKRSHTPFTRESQSRRKQELMSHFRNDFSQSFLGKLYLKPEEIPEGYSIYWAAKSVKGHSRQEKLQNLFSQGFFYATAEDFPKRAYIDDYGNINDSMEVIESGANILLMRDKDINDAHLAHFQKVSERNIKPVQDAQREYNPQEASRNNRSFFPDAPSVSGLSRSNY